MSIFTPALVGSNHTCTCIYHLRKLTYESRNINRIVYFYMEYIPLKLGILLEGFKLVAVGKSIVRSTTTARLSISTPKVLESILAGTLHLN